VYQSGATASKAYRSPNQTPDDGSDARAGAWFTIGPGRNSTIRT
jgi:hypothetical protein